MVALGGEACAGLVHPSSPSSPGEPSRNGRTRPRWRSVGAEVPQSRVVVKGERFWVAFVRRVGKLLVRDMRRIIQHTVLATEAWPPFLRGVQPHHSSAPFSSQPQMYHRWLGALATGSGRPRGETEGGWLSCSVQASRHSSPLTGPLIASRLDPASPQAGLCIFLVVPALTSSSLHSLP